MIWEVSSRHSPCGSVIEIFLPLSWLQPQHVTPLVGVWIEITMWSRMLLPKNVTPLVGVWIEIWDDVADSASAWVTPLVGVWIEIFAPSGNTQNKESLSLRECGLKYCVRHCLKILAPSLQWRFVKDFLNHIHKKYTISWLHHLYITLNQTVAIWPRLCYAYKIFRKRKEDILWVI